MKFPSFLRKPGKLLGKIITLIRRGFFAWVNIYFKPIRPSSVSICLTSRCNSNCIYCETHLHDPKNDLTTQQVIDIIENVSKSGAGIITLGGGEPFVHPGIFEILEFCHKKQIRIGLNTNGINIYTFNDKQIEIIKRCVNSIRVSIDSPDPAINDRIRGKAGYLECAIKSIRRLKESGFEDIGLSTVISKHNFKDLDKIIYFAKGLGLKKIEFIPVTFNSSVSEEQGLKVKESCSIEEKDVPSLMDSLKLSLNIAKEQKITTNLGTLMFYIEKYFKYASSNKNFVSEIDKSLKCVIPSTILCIGSAGQLLPCSYLRPVGNCINDPIGQWRNNEKLNELRENLRKGKLFDNCRQCVFVFSSNYVYRFPRDLFKKGGLTSFLCKIKEKLTV